MINQPYPPDPRTPVTSQGVPGPNDDTVQSANAGGAYMESQHQNYVDPAGNQVDKRVDVYEDKNLQKANVRN